MLFIIVIAVLYACAMMTLYLYNDPKDTKEAVIPNEPNKDYLLCLGTEVKNSMVMQSKAERL